jgi:predicted dehydrogenase
MLEFGLIGAGAMAGVYADRLARRDDTTVSGVASPNSAEAFVADNDLDATAYSTAAELCVDGDVDAVAILTPTHTHPDVVEEVADYGLPIICEKPLARTLAGAERIRSAVEAADVPFMTAHVVRFFPQYAEARRRVEAGEIGSPGVVRTKRAFGFAGSRGWFEDVDRSGGTLLDLGIHDLDYLRWTLGDVERVFTRRTTAGGEGTSEVALTLLRFADGTVGHHETWAVEVPSVPFTTAFEFAGDEGHISYDVDDVQSVRTFDDEGIHTPMDPIADDTPLREDGYARQLDHFVDCVRGGETPSVSVADGIESLRLGLAALESAERGEPVVVSEVEP